MTYFCLFVGWLTTRGQTLLAATLTADMLWQWLWSMVTMTYFLCCCSEEQMLTRSQDGTASDAAVFV